MNSQNSEFTKQTMNSIQPDQNIMIPELSGIHVISSFEVSSYFGQAVCIREKDIELILNMR